MSRKFTRNISEVKDVTQLAKHTTTQNDLIQTTDGSVYVVTKNGYEQITGGASDSDLQPMQTDITSLKTSNTQLRNRVSDLETANEEKTTQITDLETRIAELESATNDDGATT